MEQLAIDEPMLCMDEFVSFDPQSMPPDSAIDINDNGDLDEILSSSNTTSLNNPGPAVLTPGTMRLINNVWTPLGEIPNPTGQYPLSEQLGYFDYLPSNTRVNPQSIATEQQPEPPKAKRHSQPSSRAKEASVSAPVKKQRRARKKMVRSEEEQRRNRENFLERNRKAAQKCRQQKKVWMGEVQQKKDAASELMNILGMEVIQLVEEVKRLRTMVDAHKWCEHASSTTHPTNDLVLPSVTSTSDSPSSSHDSGLGKSGRNREASVSSRLLEGLSGNESQQDPSPLEQRFRDFSDPCWKLAKEACRRFSEINPDFLSAMLANNFSDAVSTYHASTRSHSNSVDSTMDGHSTNSRQTSIDPAIDQVEDRRDSGFSEMTTSSKSESTSHDGVVVGQEFCTTPGLLMPNPRAPESEDFSAAIVDPASIFFEGSRKQNSGKGLVDIQKSAARIPPPRLAKGGR